MPRIQPLTKDSAPQASIELLEAVEKKLGKVPNLLGTMANAPAALQAYLSLSQILDSSSLSPHLRESVALAIATQSGCGYCGSAHSAIGKMVGLESDQIESALRASSNDPKTQAAINLALSIVRDRGWVSDDDFNAARNDGLTDAEIAEIIPLTLFNLYTNYFNHIAETEIDFPVVELPEPVNA
ncbi:MAG: carboxymuconolactone decarboxylase family protein [Phycisphaerales bacterium JB043]